MPALSLELRFQQLLLLAYPSYTRSFLGWLLNSEIETVWKDSALV